MSKSKCHQKDTVNSKNVLLYSEHYKDDDHAHYKWNRLLELTPKKKLKELIIPNLKLPAILMKTIP